MSFDIEGLSICSNLLYRIPKNLERRMKTVKLEKVEFRNIFSTWINLWANEAYWNMEWRIYPISFDKWNECNASV